MLMQAVREVKAFFNQVEGTSLRAWLRHFDLDHDQKISLSEFIRGMRKMNFVGDVNGIFAALDADKSGELSLEEIDEAQSILWRRFRAWCVTTFEDVADMMRRLNSPTDSLVRRPTFMAKAQMVGPADDFLSASEFCEGIQRAGWSDGFETVLFAALDTEDKGCLGVTQLRWLELEKRRQKRKDQAKRRAMLEGCKRASGWKAAEAVLVDFKAFLKRKYGHFVKAWRCALSPDGSMVLQKHDLFKACSNMGWAGDVRLLHRAFDKDGSGAVAIEELDPHGAELLAHFHAFVEQRFGNATAAFRALDRFNTRKLRQPEFLSSLKACGFQHPGKNVYLSLDVQGTGGIMVEDMLFLDKWKPPSFLTSQPNQQAADELKAALLRHSKNYLKAWRHVLDVDASNCCSFGEFEEACKKIAFKGDVPGAWRSLDEDMSGFITLHELDPVSSDAMMVFRRWCDQEFGSVRSAFGVFDVSGDDEVTYREFRRSSRIYGFEGNVHVLFHALDTERNGSLSVDEVVFLDKWEFADDLDGQPVGVEESTPVWEDMIIPHPVYLTEYVTAGPGPAAYELPATFASVPATPMVRFGGAYSFRRRQPNGALPGLLKDAPLFPSPASYDDRRGWTVVAPSKPSWAFGTELRRAVMPVQQDTRPGPGQYTPLTHRGQATVFTPRRPLRVHPLFRDGFMTRDGRPTGTGGRRFP